MWIVITLFVVIVFFIAIFFIKKSIQKELERQRKILEQERKLLETVTKSDRGTETERDLVLKLLKNGIPARTIFHDLYVKKPNGKFSQIDIVVPTKVGIIVFEVKDYSGWIFGKGNQSQWTQVLAYGEQKFRFYNPIMQNNGHITVLRKKLRQFEKVPFYSIIVFYGDCELRDVSFIPQGTFLTYSEGVLDVIRTILENNKIANYTDKYEVIKILKEAVENGEDIETKVKHIENIRDMLGKNRIFE